MLVVPDVGKRVSSVQELGQDVKEIAIYVSSPFVYKSLARMPPNLEKISFHSAHHLARLLEFVSARHLCRLTIEGPVREGDLAPLRDCERLTHLFVSGCVDDLCLASVAKAPNLKHLELDAAHLHGAAFRFLAGLQLQHLRLARNGLRDNDLFFLQHCSLLRDLSLPENSVLTDETLVTVADNCPSLVSLQLGVSPHFTEQALVRLLKTCLSLETLDLKQASFLTDAGFKHMEHLKRIYLCRAHALATLAHFQQAVSLAVNGARSLASLPHKPLPCLQSIRLANCRLLTPKEIRKFFLGTRLESVSVSGFRECKKAYALSRLKLAAPCVRLANCLSVASLGDLHGLIKELYLEACPLLESLAGLEACRKLLTLSVIKCHAIKTLSPLRLPHLQNLSLVKCNALKIEKKDGERFPNLVRLSLVRIRTLECESFPASIRYFDGRSTVRDVKALAKALPSLKELVLSGVEDDDVAHLCRFTHLQSLTLRNSPARTPWLRVHLPLVVLART